MIKKRWTIILFVVTVCNAQNLITTQKVYTGPFEYILSGNYSDYKIDLDSCKISYDTVLSTITISGVLLDNLSKGRLPMFYVAIGIENDSSKKSDKFEPIDSTKTDNVGRFSISSKIQNEDHSVFTYGFLGYYTYYIYLNKIINVLKK